MNTFRAAIVLLSLGFLVSCGTEPATQEELKRDGVAVTTAGSLAGEYGTKKPLVVAKESALTKVLTDIVVEELVAAGIEAKQIDREALEQRVLASFKRRVETLKGTETSPQAK